MDYANSLEEKVDRLEHLFAIHEGHFEYLAPIIDEIRRRLDKLEKQENSINEYI